MNETTILEKRPTTNGQQETKSEGSAWKQVTLGGVSGILMGAGLLYGGQVAAKELDTEVTPEDAQPTEDGLKVAASHDEISFGDAFEAARAEVGPGGVFHWHGGIYNTYSAEEWNNMSGEQKLDFAQQVKPEVSADLITTPTDTNTHIVVEHHVYHHDAEHSGTSDEIQLVGYEPEDASDSDVHIVGYSDMDGHLVVGVDTNNDGLADVAIIDVDDSGNLSGPDVFVDDHGNMATYEEIVDASSQDPNLMVSIENPDITPDMPDYMSDALIDI